jgi:hypothetical protein
MTAVNYQLSAFLAVSLLAVATRLERISLGAVVAALYPWWRPSIKDQIGWWCRACSGA